MRYESVSAEEFATRPELAAWRYADGAITSEFHLPSFTAAARSAAEMAVLADAADHHPDLEVRYPGVVRVTLTTHDAGGVTRHDVLLAEQIEQLVRGAAAGRTG